ncbi:MAG: hypothetical protein ACFFDN_34795, partial [Candidatus Hodarchaeota archaeon]
FYGTQKNSVLRKQFYFFKLKYISTKNLSIIEENMLILMIYLKYKREKIEVKEEKLNLSRKRIKNFF